MVPLILLFLNTLSNILKYFNLKEINILTEITFKWSERITKLPHTGRLCSILHTTFYTYIYEQQQATFLTSFPSFNRDSQ